MKMSKLIIIKRKGKVLHDFPYKIENRKCPHTGIVNITKSGQCVFNCSYCYAKGYAWSTSGNIIEVFENTPELLDKELNAIKICPPLYFCAVTDPFQPLNLVYKTSLKSMNVAVKHNVYFKIITKSNYVLKILETDWYNYKKFHISFTCESINGKKLRAISNAPDVKRRLAAIEELKSAKIKVTARIDPIIAGFTDDFNEISELVEALNSKEIDHITVSTGTFNPRVFNNLILSVAESEFSSLSPKIKSSYELSNGTYKMNKQDQMKFYQELDSLFRRYGMTFSPCLDSINSADLSCISPCDSTSKLTLKNGSGQFIPICSSDCLNSCPNKKSPPCGEKKLMTEYPFKWSTLKGNR
jgi:DNA repair photolyase